MNDFECMAKVSRQLEAHHAGQAALGELTAASKPRRAAACSRVVQLEPGEVLRLEKSAGLRRLEVEQGIAWLTTTPADGDTLLPAGDRYEPGGNWPIVIQALGQTRLVLVLR